MIFEFTVRHYFHSLFQHTYCSPAVIHPIGRRASSQVLEASKRKMTRSHGELVTKLYQSLLKKWSQKLFHVNV